MRYPSRAAAVIGFCVLFAGVGPATVVWAAPGDVSQPRSSQPASGSDMDPAMPGMPGMAGATEMTGMTATPTAGPDEPMRGMDTGSMPGTTATATHDNDAGPMPGMDDTSMPGMTDTGTDTVPLPRPRTLVLGGFGVFNAGVLVVAAFVRRRTRRERDRRTARRAAGRTSGAVA
jgi:hypothetical protein